MITLFNTINSISTSVTARIKQYGAMRAVGMDGNQFTRMIAEEAFTYSISGFVIGGVIGIALSRFLYIKLLTWYFGTLWSMPVEFLLLLLCFLSLPPLLRPTPRRSTYNMAITETINEW